MDIPISKGYMEEIGKNPNKSERIAKLQIFHDQAVKKANEKMIGRIPASEVGKRYPVAVVLSLIIFLRKDKTDIKENTDLISLKNHMFCLFEAPGPL